MKELEYSKKRLAQQHEDDLEQLLALKKQLEKKVTNCMAKNKEIKVVFVLRLFEGPSTFLAPKWPSLSLVPFKGPKKSRFCAGTI